MHQTKQTEEKCKREKSNLNSAASIVHSDLPAFTTRPSHLPHNVYRSYNFSTLCIVPREGIKRSRQSGKEREI